MDLLKSRVGRPLIIAHRGLTAGHIPNTLPAIQAATQIGIDGVEIDVQSTADHELVVFHDERIKFQSQKVDVGRLTAGQITSINVGQARVPLLREVLENVDTTRTFLVLDVKSPHIATKVASLVAHYDLQQKVLVASFDSECLLEFYRCCPDLGRVQVIGFSRAARSPEGLALTLAGLIRPVTVAERVRASAIIFPLYRVTEPLVELAHKTNIAVIAWIPKPMMNFSRGARLAVDGFLGDNPLEIRRQLTDGA